LVPITFNLDQALDPKQLRFEGLEATLASNPRTFENFEIFINATEAQGQLTLECQYNTNLFQRETIQRRLAELETLLRGVVQDSSAGDRPATVATRVRAHLISSVVSTERTARHRPPYPSEI
jgi:hypothetical protein